MHYAFDYVATKGINKSIISNELLYNKHRINILVSVLTGCLLIFGSYAFYRSVVFLKTTRSEFVQLSGNLRAVVEDLNSSLNSEKVDPVKLEAIQEKTCSLVRNYTFVKDIGFYTPYLFPSWFSSLSTDLQKQYRDRFSASFSSFLIKKYTGLLDAQLSFDPSADRSYTEISKSFYSFSDFMYNFSDFYAKITARNSKDYDASIYVISKLVYGNSCTDTLKADGFLSKVDPDALEELKKKYSSVKVRATNVLAERANEYFSAMINKHPLLYDSKIIQGAIDNFNDYANKFKSNSGSSADSDDSDRFQVISKVFVDLVAHYKALSDALASHTDVTSSQEKFFGDEFKTAKDKIIKNPMFDPSSISDINNSAITTYNKFQKQLKELTANTYARYPVLFIGDSKDPTKGTVSINPDVVQLFNALGDINGMYLATLGKNTVDSNEAPFGNDLFAIAKILPKNASWVSDKLQSFIQRNANFQKNYSMLDFTSYPDVFANNLRDYVNNFSQAYWNQALCSSLLKTSGNSSVSRKNKPKWSDENSDDEFIDDPDISDDDDGSIDYLGLPASAPYLANITNILRRQRVKELASALELIYKSQADTILKKLYNSFEKRGYFGAGYSGFDWWNGDASPAYAIFNVTSDDGLRTTLDSQKARVQDYYNQNIASIMDNFTPLFQSSRFGALYYSRWKSIADAVAQDSKSSTFQAFSTYVTGPLSRFKTDSCGDVLFNYMDAGDIPDYFDARVQNIKKQLYDRCRVIYMGIAIASHDDFARYFNQTFAGRFPFTQPGSFTGSTDLSDLQTGLGLYDNLLSGKIRFLEKESTQYNSKPEAKDFNRKMAAATTFFNLAKSKDGDTVGIPQFNISFKFRSNKREEVFANQIVNWKMQVGRQLYGSEYGQLQDANFLWRYGDVIKLSFSLPNDGSYDLSDDDSDSNDPNKFTSDNTINYVFNENWSLLKLIFKYNRCTQIDRTKCANYQTLKFSIPIGKNKNLVVYCDISLSDSNNNKVDIPTFPYKAVPIKN